MLKTVKYVVYKNYGYTLNYEPLYDLYSPIVGSEATNLYINLFHETNKQQKIGNVSIYLDDFYKQCNLSPVKFAELRSKLEAIGLLTTYLEDIDNELTYHFVINQPLSFAQFIDNSKLRQLLINAIGQLNYEKFEFMYLPVRITNNATNVSATFEMVFNDRNLNNISSFNFDKLYESIAKNTSAVITINDVCKSIIDNYYKNYNLSESEIEHIVYGCIVSNDGNFEVDADLLSMKAHEYITSAKNVSVFTNIKLHRNAAMFIKNLDPNEISMIFNEYKNLNSEQYLAAIYKASLSTEEIETIDVLRKTYKLPDYVINLLIDFSIFKTNGHLNRTYISKVAKTINALNLTKLKDIYDYFRFNNAVINEINKQQVSSATTVNEDPIDWDNI